MKESIAWLAKGKDLPAERIRKICTQLLDVHVPDAEKAEFLIALRKKGETPDEIAAFVRAFLEHARQPVIPHRENGRPLLDVCGTGGDKAGLFNVSTAVMFVCAAAGARVVKHGNRSISSKSGGADVLAELGVPIDLGPDEVGDFLARCGYVFLFAPLYHPAFAAVASVRKELAARGQLTVFNILGPLLNPAQPDYQLAGVFQPHLTRVFADVFALLGRKAAWAVHGKIAGDGGLDEISTLGPTEVCMLDANGVHEFCIDPASLGFSGASLAELAGSDPKHNAKLLIDLLEGRDHGPRLDLVLLNAAAALCVCEIAHDLPDGIRIARSVIESGAAREALARGTGR
jgi:anthranilate phosphoribosyltransferase